VSVLSKIELPQAVRRALDSPRLAALFRPLYPPFAVELCGDRLVAVALERDKTGARLVGHRVVELPPGLLSPAPGKPLVTEPEPLLEPLRQAVAGLPGFAGQLSLLLPDRAGRVTFVDLEQVAPSRAETAELLRWKLKRTTPFRTEDCRLDFQVFPSLGGGYRCLVTLVPLQVLDPIEQALATLGWEAGLIDLSTFNLWNLLEPALARAGDVLLLNALESSVSVLVARRGLPLFLRTKATPGGGAAPPAAASGNFAPTVAGLLAELQPTLLFHQDRMGGAVIERTVVRVPAAIQAELSEELRVRHGLEAEPAGLGEIGGAEGLLPDERALVAAAAGAALGR
jgi:hypothetical protein